MSIRRSRIRLSLLSLVLLAAPTYGQLERQSPPALFEEPLSPRIANYRMDVVLHPADRTLEGNQSLVWYNLTGETVGELQFHLYLNAFRNSRTTFMEESGGTMRGYAIDEDGWGFIDVERLALSSLDETLGEHVRAYRAYRPGAGADWRRAFPVNSHSPAADLTAQMEFVRPDDGNPHDQTVFRVPLPEPLAPGEAVALDIDFRAQLPTPPFARTGALEEYFFVGQWFPKIGVFEGGEWNAHQFHYNSEFFADYGVYDVRMTVPSDFVVGATGLEVEVIDNGDGTATHYYHAEDVHDFAWTASPEFLVFEGRAQDVEIRALVQPDHAEQGERHVAAARLAVEYFQDHYGDYPYPNLTVVDPRRGAEGSGGMEYPTLITAGTYYNLPTGLRTLELVILHEFGHNYWYHLLANNEFEEAWLDEGINTYTEGRVFEDHYGGNVIDLLGFRITEEQVQRVEHIITPMTDPVYRKAWEYYSPSSYAVNSYARPGLILKTLRNYLGPETMNEAMRAYVSHWRFKHPKTADFIQVMSDVAGEYLSWYFDQALFTNAALDYSVSAVESNEIVDAGYGFDRDVDEPTRTEVTEALGQEADQKETDADAPSLFENEVRIRRLGEFRFPVEVEIVFDDGEVIRERWDGQEPWKKLTYLKPVRLSSATVDPDKKIPLDRSYTNNSRTLEPRRLGINKVVARWTFWWQCVLDLLAL